MKKFGMVVAGILMAGAMVYAEDTTPAAVAVAAAPVAAPVVSDTWSFAGTKVQHAIFRMDSTIVKTSGTGITIGHGDERDIFKFKVTKQIDPTLKMSLEYATDDVVNPKTGNKDFDSIGKIFITKNVTENLEVQAVVCMDTTTGLNFYVDQLNNSNGDVYLKYTFAPNTFIKFKPYEASLQVGDEMKSDLTQNVPGIELETKMDAIKLYGVLNSVELQPEAGKDAENKFGIKAGANFAAGGIDATGEFSYATVDEKTVKAAGVNMALNARAKYTMDAFSVKGEFAMYQINRKDDNSGTGIFAKGDYTMKMSDKLSLIPYVSIKNLSKNFAFDNDDYSALRFNRALAEGFTIIAVGADVVIAGLKINNELELRSTGKEYYGDNKGEAVKSATVFRTVASYEF